jgi:hypothetical protein
MSAQISKDGNHVMLAVQMNRDTKEKHCYYTSVCIEVYFTESFNGGETWSNPIVMTRANMTDPVNRMYPSMLYEHDTGRVYIGYKKEHLIGIAVREPNDTVFKEIETDLWTGKNDVTVALRQTIEKKGKKYLHVVWQFTRGEIIKYSRSADDGKAWSEAVTIAEAQDSRFPVNVAVNNDAVEGVMYVQYFHTVDKSIRMVWTKGHGIKWSFLLVVGADNEDRQASDMWKEW